MTRASLRLRLMLAASLLILIAMAVAGFALVLAFDRALDRRALDELQDYIRTLSAQVEVGADGNLRLGSEPVDPRFEQPYGGLYWQVDSEKGPSLRSRSLWDQTFALPDGALAVGQQHVHELAGPAGAHLLAAERAIEIGSGSTPVKLRIIAALDRKELADIRNAYLSELVPSLLVLGAALIAAMALFVGYAFVPFRRLQAALADVHAGRSQRILGDHPEEVRPLIEDLNALIASQSESLDQARAQAGDLAHGLKTPTVVLEALAQEVERKGHGVLAAEIMEQATMIRKTVERTLKRTRAGLSAAGAYRRIAAEPIASKIIASLSRTPQGLQLRWIVDVSRQSTFPGDATDLYEIIGNLVDNAMKWAKSTIAVSIENAHGRFVLRIEDDGPGMPEGVAETLERGKRLDETRPGTGFGLAIVKDLAEAFRGTIEFSRSDLGGLMVQVAIPI